jgi:alkylhydroperoxidase/carboxymuconolactone decarboxylase family protein YurZ
MKDELTSAELGILKKGYDREKVVKYMGNALPLLYEPSKAYISAITGTFTGDLPDEDEEGRDRLSRLDRERCIIALLASRGEESTLAIHIYIAMAEGVTPDEIANIILLTGVYSGVSNFTNGLGVLLKMTTVLRGLIKEEEGELESAVALEKLSETFA